jgi:ABC-2 type transport system permease protein
VLDAPWLLAGRVAIGVSVTMMTVYLAGAYAALERAGYAQFFPWSVVGWFLLFLCLSVWTYGSLFIAIGAAVTDMKEAQSLMTPMMLLIGSADTLQSKMEISDRR